MDLNYLANLCPSNNGVCVYQARALFNSIYTTIVNYSDECSSGARGFLFKYQTNNAEGNLTYVNKLWDVSLFPNPAQNKITIVGKNESEVLKIKVKDLSDRLVLVKDLKTSDFIANLDLDLINGVYIIFISNNKNEKVTKKLVVER